ncbi:MAG: DinB family protein, partial [Terriglobales bacterium]
IALTEELFHGMISGMLKTPGEAGMQEKVQGKEDMILKNIAVVTQKAQAPEVVRPTGKYDSKAELVEAFESMRAANLKLLAEHSAELHDHFLDGPVGPLDAYQWLMFTAAHSRRHTTQIKNVKAAPGYPKT